MQQCLIAICFDDDCTNELYITHNASTYKTKRHNLND